MISNSDMQPMAICCPKCEKPLTVQLITDIRITGYGNLKTDGVELDGNDDKGVAPPVMYSDDFCMLVGYYGKVENAEMGQFSRRIKKIICPDCGELKGYKVFEDDNKISSLVTEDEYKSLLEKKWALRKFQRKKREE